MQFSRKSVVSLEFLSTFGLAALLSADIGRNFSSLSVTVLTVISTFDFVLTRLLSALN